MLVFNIDHLTNSTILLSSSQTLIAKLRERDSDVWSQSERWLQRQGGSSPLSGDVRFFERDRLQQRRRAGDAGAIPVEEWPGAGATEEEPQGAQVEKLSIQRCYVL